MNDKLDVDATKLFESLKYQIHVAIEYCHLLGKTDALWIEVFGDVTIEGLIQVEVKNYADDLSDSHLNLWNTLNNWLKPEFSHEKYVNLILLTTQAYGERTLLKNWENSDTEGRLTILQAIHQAGLARFEKAKLSTASTTHAYCNSVIRKNADGETSSENGEGQKLKSTSPSEALKLQNKVMADGNLAALRAALPKIKIITEQPSLQGLINKYKIKYLKHIIECRQDEFIDSLFGFMTNVKKFSEGWKVIGSEFDKKFAELTARYMYGTVKFPRINSKEIELQASLLDVRERPFAKKLDEIGVDEALIRDATVELLHAGTYITELIKDTAISQDDIEEYSTNELELHQRKRKSTMYRIKSDCADDDTKTESCQFYFDRCAENVEKLGGYDTTPVKFRNGIYHMLADQNPTTLQNEFFWRLW